MRILGWLISSFMFVAVTGGAGAYAALSYFSSDLPDYSQLAEYEPSITTRIHASDGRLMDEFAIENRLFVPIHVIPDHVRQAFISAEDQNFNRHRGIDPRSIVRAALQNIRNPGARPEGASTITQQVAKNFLLSSDVTFDRKIREALVALRMERQFSKEQILELYLNQIYLGQGAYGVAAAALAYFNKPLADLTLEEAAYLAALPKAPNNYHPRRRNEAAIARRNYVLGRMHADGFISEDERDEAMSLPLEVDGRDQRDRVQAEFFSEEVRRSVQRIYGSDTLYTGGLSVRTSINPRFQELADEALRNGLINYDRRFGWRGAIDHIDSFDDWPGQLGEIGPVPGAGSWQLATALEVESDGVLIGTEDRTIGWLPMSEMRWARPYRRGSSPGAEPQRPTDVVEKGDVFLVEWLPESGSHRIPVGITAPRDPDEAVPDNGAADDAEAEADDDGLLEEISAEAETEAEAENDPPRETQQVPVYGLRQLPEVDGAVVAMDPHTGRVLAATGGYSFEQSEYNRATQAERQPGSAFKPFVYLSALEEGYSPSTILQDSPVTISQGPGMAVWQPSNYSGDYLGSVPMRVGVERSRNLMTVRLLQEMGLEKVRDTARRFGIYDEMPLLYSMALGAGETTPLRLTAGFAMLVNGGKKIEPTFIDRVQDRTGRTIYARDERRCRNCMNVAWEGQQTPELPDERESVTDPVSAYQMVSMLEGVIQRGTGRSLAGIGKPLAGKTGTTNDVRDAWFVGFTPDLVVGVYVGFDQPRTLGQGQTGSSVAAPIFGDFMSAALDGVEVPPFRIPPDAQLARVNPTTGLAARSGESSIWEAFRPGDGPPTSRERQPSLQTESSEPQAPTFSGSGTGGLY